MFDVISKTRIELESVLAGIVTAEMETTKFYFTPDLDGKESHIELITERNDLLFVRPLLKDLNKPLLFPLTSHA